MSIYLQSGVQDTILGIITIKKIHRILQLIISKTYDNISYVLDI